MKDRILTEIRSLSGHILDFTQDLVKIPTENPPGRAYRQCVDLIESRLSEIGLEPIVIEVPPPKPGEGDARGESESYPRYCVLAGHGAGNRILYFHGHYDVVPAASEAQFTPHIKDGRLFGRGTADMKAGLAAMIYAVRCLKNLDVDLSGRVGLVIVPDEETGGWRGARWLAEEGLLGKEGVGMLMPEPAGRVVWNANRGAISLRVTVKGKAAHVGFHYDGINAFERMMLVVAALTGLKAEVETRRTRFRIDPEEACHSILMMGGRCEGGTNFNTVPEECSFTVDRRINPEEDLEVEKQRLFSVFDVLRRDGIDLDVEILQEGESGGLDESDPFAQTFAAAVEEICGEQPEFELCPGLLETRFYANQGIPALAYGPGSLTVAHGPNEYVDVEKVYECAAIYALAAWRILGQQQRVTINK